MIACCLSWDSRNLRASVAESIAEPNPALAMLVVATAVVALPLVADPLAPLNALPLNEKSLSPTSPLIGVMMLLLPPLPLILLCVVAAYSYCRLSADADEVIGSVGSDPDSGRCGAMY